MKKYKVNGKVVVADSLREAIVKYRKFNDAFVLKHFSGKYLSENGDFVFDIDNARRFSTENEAKAKANAMSSEDDTFTVVSVKDATDPQKEKGKKESIAKMSSLLQKAISLNNSGKWNNLRDVLDDAVDLHEDAYYREGYFYDSANSVKDAQKTASEITEGDIITREDGSKWQVTAVRKNFLGVQIRMNSINTPVKTDEITYRPNDRITLDSVKDMTAEDSAASNIVKEIKSKYPDVHIHQGAKQYGDKRLTALNFSNYPGEKDHDIIKQNNWQSFLNYIVKKYIPEFNDKVMTVYPYNVMFVDSSDSVKDRLGEGKCAPTGSDTLVSDANAILRSVQKISKDDPNREKEVKYYLDRADDLEEKIAKERKSADVISSYWQDHRREMLDNAIAAERILKQIWKELE